MRDYTDAANLHARLCAIKSHFLSQKDYASLARNQDETLSDKGAGHPDLIAGEEILFQEQIAKILPLAVATKLYTPLFLAFFRQFEALNAKLILAKIFGFQTLEQWYDIGPYSILQRCLLSETTTLTDIHAVLAGTYLSDVLEDVSDYGQMEVRVDICAARNLYEASAPLNSEAKLDFDYLIGRRIAITSTMMSLRLKKTYHWNEEKIRLYLEGFHNVFEGKIWPHLKAVEQVLDQSAEQSRASGGQEPSVTDIEHYLEQYYYTWISSMFHRDFHSICCVVSYLWLLFYQIRNLFKIIDGRRFGLSPEVILARIVCNT